MASEDCRSGVLPKTRHQKCLLCSQTLCSVSEAPRNDIATGLKPDSDLLQPSALPRVDVSLERTPLQTCHTMAVFVNGHSATQ